MDPWVLCITSPLASRLARKNRLPERLFPPMWSSPSIARPMPEGTACAMDLAPSRPKAPKSAEERQPTSPAARLKVARTSKATGCCPEARVGVGGRLVGGIVCRMVDVLDHWLWFALPVARPD
jgi:hypothetical protein